ncbi:tRNA lysidine(34) synthetase TilS [Croceicoccus marinus]|jgi:tRNA(Ile)-lysidine synthase|uniref:tRNA lysidine(34) synthetase TilS n=1 Tax=Croceicoccus marinus TaxID=450378 RepID=UPI001FD1E2E3|nr:tRNA lysidine(34) synthetase TilS [Croceicoccus marinus]
MAACPRWTCRRGARRAAIDTPDDLPDDLNADAARFARDCAPLAAPDARIGLAVSGGPDSLAMLALAARAFPDRVEAVTVDHRLRPESADEAAMVARICGDLGVPHTALTVSVERSGNMQANARMARYRALGDWARERGLAAVASAHHADDQAENLLMRLNRGAGLKGLAAMRAARAMPMAGEVVLIRPLLGWRRSELASVCERAGLTPAQDPSNEDDRYDRARIRAAMARQDWLNPQHLAQSARHLREAFDALEHFAEAEIASRVERGAAGALYRPSPDPFPRAVRYRVVERLLETLGTARGAARGAEIERLLAALESGGGGTLGGLHCVSRRGRDGPEWTFTPEPPRKTG